MLAWNLRTTQTSAAWKDHDMPRKSAAAAETAPARVRESVGLSVGPEGRQALRLLAYKLTGELGRRVTLTDALLAAVKVAGDHSDETARSLPGGAA